jgi:hypothetical protein
VAEGPGEGSFADSGKTVDWSPWLSQTRSAGIKPAGCAAAKRLPKRGCGQDSAGEDSRTTSSGANIRSAHSLDFLCRDARLIVEVDATHSEDHEIVYDERRSAYLKRKATGLSVS